MLRLLGYVQLNQIVNSGFLENFENEFEQRYFVVLFKVEINYLIDDALKKFMNETY